MCKRLEYYERSVASKTKWYAESFVRRQFGRNISWNHATVCYSLILILLRQIATDNFGTWAIFALQKLLEHSEMIKIRRFCQVNMKLKKSISLWNHFMRKNVWLHVNTLKGGLIHWVRNEKVALDAWLKSLALFFPKQRLWYLNNCMKTRMKVVFSQAPMDILKRSFKTELTLLILWYFPSSFFYA